MTDISVVITAYNRKHELKNALASFTLQTYPMNRFEVIVVDDGSLDDPLAEVSTQAWPFRLKALRLDENRGVSVARNCGVEQAEGTLVVFSDSDMIVPAHYLQAHWVCHEGHTKQVVSAPNRRHVFTQIYPEQTKTARWANLLQRAPELCTRLKHLKQENQQPTPILYPEDVVSGYVERISTQPLRKGRRELPTAYPRWDDCPLPWLAYAGSNSSVLRQSLLDVGGFDEKLRFRHDDRDIGYRLHRSGHRFVLNSRIVGIHQDHLLNQERKKLKYLSLHDYAIMLANHNSLDMYLFGLYQTDKRKFHLPFICKLKQQLDDMEWRGETGKRDARRIKKILRRHVLSSVAKCVESSPVARWHQPLHHSKGFYENWVRQMKSKYSYPELLLATSAMVGQLQPQRKRVG